MSVSFLNLHAGYTGMLTWRKSTELYIYNFCIFLYVILQYEGFKKRWMNATVLSILWVFPLIYFFLILMEKKFINKQQTAL